MGLEGVEILMWWEEAFGITISDAEAASLSTPRQAATLIATKLPLTTETRPCPTQRAFHHLRRHLMEAGIPRAQIRPGVKGKTLMAGTPSRAWAEFRGRTGIPFHKSMTLAETVRSLAVTGPAPDLWSYGEIREIVRAVIIQIMCNDGDFHDDSDFVRDLGMG